MTKITRAVKDKPEVTEVPVLTEEMKAFKAEAEVPAKELISGDKGDDKELDSRLRGNEGGSTSSDVKKSDELLMRTYRYKRSSWLKLKMLSDKLTVQQGKLVSLESMVEEGLQLLFKQYGIADVDLTTGFYSEQDGV